MSLNDPFNHVKVQTESGLVTLNSLLARWQTLINTTNTSENQEFQVVSDGLKEAFFELQDNIADLDKTIGNRTRFQIEESEIKARKAFVSSCKKKLASVKSQLQDPTAKAKIESDKRGALLSVGGKKAKTKYEKLEEEVDNENDDFIAGQQQYQDNIMANQDQKLGELVQVVSTLGEMASTINQELDSQGRVLDDYTAEVDKTHGRLENANRAVNRILEKSKVALVVLIILAISL